MLPNQIARRWEQEWQRLSQSSLPIRPQGSIWCFSRHRNRDDPPQGWKLHISATILSACQILELVSPCLKRHQALFKAPQTLAELHKLNAGVEYGFSQVGKFITVYPRSTELALSLAAELHHLTAGLPAPSVAYDEPWRARSCVHYRYGQFYFDQTIKVGNQSVPAIARPDGRLVPCLREPRAAVPQWLTDPFRPRQSATPKMASTPLETDYGNYEAIVQRGRGGVYRALDLNSVPPKVCILKEGRRHGETDWLGRDGVERIRREAIFLKAIAPACPGVPRVSKTFRANACFYLVMEHCVGRNLHALIISRERISPRRSLTYCREMARIMADIHAAGWAWLDCKPGNFLCGRNYRLWAIDFEGACRQDKPDSLRVVTPGYAPPKWALTNPQADDLFALGTSFAQLIARSNKPPEQLRAIFANGTKVPQSVLRLIRSLRHADPHFRPTARQAQHLLEKMLGPAKINH